MALAASLTFVVASSPGGLAAAEGATGVDSLSGSVSGGALVIAGRASFVDLPKLVGVDPASDARVSSIGADLVEATIGRPSQSSDVLSFAVRVSDPVPQLTTPPAPVKYNWTLRLASSSAGVECVLAADRFVTSVPPGAPPRFSGSYCMDPMQTPIAGIGGSIENGVIRWNVPTAAIEPNVSHVRPSPTAIYESEVYVTVGSQALDTLRVTAEYEVPQAIVYMGIAPAGTDPAAVPLTRSAYPDAGGSFGTSIASPVPGDYVVVAKACYGDGNCGLSSAAVTV